MAKSKKRKKLPKFKKGAFKVYIGIFICISIIFAVLYLVTNSNKNVVKDDQKTISKIEEYLDTQKKNISKNSSKDISTAHVLSDLNLSKTHKSEQNISTNNTFINLKKDENVSQKETGINLKQDANISDTQKDANINLKKDENLSQKETKTPEVLQKHQANTRAKLAIIIDDVAYRAQADKIKSLGLKITPSIFPPTKAHPNTVAISKDFEFYMIHLPLEAMFFSKAEPNTLKVGDSKSKIEDRISTIKNQFGNVKYINNHTGSKFTSNYKSMQILLSSLDKMGILFVDSLTSNASKAGYVSKELGLKYVKRDVFLDNDQDVSKILKQLSLAIKQAKKRGYAIAIGHPHDLTFKALKIAKQTILKDVDVVYLKEIYGLYN
ncbi:divergent polysaccharide deacetylase family protein [Campylobacter hyointestinalis]|uniref:divergent polysaccharide deacetylase family protein n=1 Tax=Campylobacter hyointestinalis TaxID=198 RepID=UPI000DCC18FE|nr:divergent polysaccharide deacetylase family protein [Campylobacter hyointestinalis]RAZ23692.1 divergent polysaccharide deacetylase family protein [Campylobacter hyointestinalis subsp. lawsonii]RAZ38092.1 divergent polysaccharide deacetylase family protein [Campylobacter hyointestinalis subsp. lawsonii]